jgi:tRNA G18 (ribose-2'-O)-methylase SpoU
MPNIIEITDLSLPELNVYSHLTEAQIRNRLEPECGIFIAESPKVINVALNNGYRPVSLLMERKHIDGQGKEIILKCGDIPVFTADRDVLSSLTGYALTRGILCAMHRPVPTPVENILSSSHRVAVLENIVDSTNIGAIFRSAAGLGFDAVLLTPSCCDPLCRRAVRVSMGTVFQIAWSRIGSSPSDWPGKGIDLIKKYGFVTAAMALSSNSVPIYSSFLSDIEKLAVILGTEGDGLTDTTVRNCDYTVRIPMYHGVDSLNVAAASAVAFWELRYRGHTPSELS